MLVAHILCLRRFPEQHKRGSREIAAAQGAAAGLGAPEADTLGGADDVGDGGQRGLLELLGVGHGHVHARDALHRRVQRVERLLHHDRRHLFVSQGLFGSKGGDAKCPVPTEARVPPGVVEQCGLGAA